MLEEFLENKKFTPQEQTFISYIQNHPESIINHTAKELAKLSFVSAPTIIRFIKKLGFNSYRDFQIEYLKKQKYQQSENNNIDKNSSIENIIKTLPNIYRQVFLATQNLSVEGAFTRTINYMMNAEQIDFYANDNNYAEITSACLKFNSIGIHCQAFNTINEVYLNHLNPKKTLAFVVSHSGNNQTMINAAYALRKKRIRVIAITGKLSTQLELICNESLYIDASQHNLPISTLLYGLSIHYIIDILYIALYYKSSKN